MQYIVIQIVAVIALKTSLTKQFDKHNNRLITFFCQCFLLRICQFYYQFDFILKYQIIIIKILVPIHAF